MDSEIGKSMTEMLGVLALMGILGVVAVKGYDEAMVRVNANMIIDDVNKRSILASQQAMMGVGNLNQVAFEKNPALNKSEISVDSIGKHLFRVNVSDVSSAVCRQILKNQYQKPIQITANGMIVSEDNDIGCGDLSTQMGFIFTNELRPCETCLIDGGGCQNDDECTGDFICRDDGLCGCLADETACGLNCCVSGEICSMAHGGGCIVPEEESECTSNQDCWNNAQFGKKYYCNITAERDESLPACYKNFQGTCQVIPNFSAYTTITLNGKNRQVYTGPTEGNLTWWSSKNVCEALNMRMLRFSDTGCMDVTKCNPKTSNVMEQLKIWGGSPWFEDSSPSKPMCYALKFYATDGTVNSGGWRNVKEYRSICVR